MGIMPPYPGPQPWSSTLTCSLLFNGNPPIPQTPIAEPEIEMAACQRVRGGVTRVEYCEAGLFNRSDCPRHLIESGLVVLTSAQIRSWRATVRVIWV